MLIQHPATAADTLPDLLYIFNRSLINIEMIFKAKGMYVTGKRLGLNPTPPPTSITHHHPASNIPKSTTLGSSERQQNDSHSWGLKIALVPPFRPGLQAPSVSPALRLTGIATSLSLSAVISSAVSIPVPLSLPLSFNTTPTFSVLLPFITIFITVYTSILRRWIYGLKGCNIIFIVD